LSNFRRLENPYQFYIFKYNFGLVSLYYNTYKSREVVKKLWCDESLLVLYGL